MDGPAAAAAECAIISDDFPNMGYKESNQVYRTFLKDTLRKYNDPVDSVYIEGALCTVVEDLTSPMFEDEYSIIHGLSKGAMYALMNTYKEIRHLKLSELGGGNIVVYRHFNRTSRIQRFANMCYYERNLQTYGIYILNEMLYSGNQAGIKIRLE